MSVHPASKPESLTLSAPHGSQQLPIEHHPQLYIVGGDVVLSARTGIPPTGLCEPQNSPEPPKIVLFRVHKGILSHNSAVFNNIFLDATAPAGDTYDEALVVPMIGDRAEDLAQLLMCLYKPWRVLPKLSILCAKLTAKRVSQLSRIPAARSRQTSPPERRDPPNG